jgi:hypothetical protein
MVAPEAAVLVLVLVEMETTRVTGRARLVGMRYRLEAPAAVLVILVLGIDTLQISQVFLVLTVQMVQ